MAFVFEVHLRRFIFESLVFLSFPWSVCDSVACLHNKELSYSTEISGMLVLIGVVVIKSACFNLYEFIFVWFCDNEYPESWDLIIVCFCLHKLGLSGISSTRPWRNSLDYNVRGKMCFTLVSSFLTDLSNFWLIIFFPDISYKHQRLSWKPCDSC